MELSRLEIEKIARLARISLTEAEKKRFGKELSEMLTYFEKLKQLDTSTVDLNLAESENTNHTRVDAARDSGIQEAILCNTPTREDQFIKVKSVL